jgi:hypothetical protein
MTARTSPLPPVSGTGKTLALLTSTLSWQKKEKLLTSQTPQPPIGQPPSESVPSSPLAHRVAATNNADGSRHKHQIYFCSRTHSQLQQVSLFFFPLCTIVIPPPLLNSLCSPPLLTPSLKGDLRVEVLSPFIL